MEALDIFDDDTRNFVDALFRGDFEIESSYVWFSKHATDIGPVRIRGDVSFIQIGDITGMSAMESTITTGDDRIINVLSEEGATTKKYFPPVHEMVWNRYHVDKKRYTLQIFSEPVSAMLGDGISNIDFSGFISLDITRIQKERYVGNFMWERSSFEYGENVYYVCMVFNEKVDVKALPVEVTVDGVVFSAEGGKTKGAR